MVLDSLLRVVLREAGDTDFDWRAWRRGRLKATGKRSVPDFVVIDSVELAVAVDALPVGVHGGVGAVLNAALARAVQTNRQVVVLADVRANVALLEGSDRTLGEVHGDLVGALVDLGLRGVLLAERVGVLHGLLLAMATAVLLQLGGVLVGAHALPEHVHLHFRLHVG